MILVDVNIFMDFITKRPGWDESAIVINKVQNTSLQGYISALTVVLLYLQLEEEYTKRLTKEFVEKVIEGFEIVTLTPEIIQEAFKHKINDFEDAIQFLTAKNVNCTEIVTRDKDFDIVKDDILIYTPEEFLDKYGRGC